MIRKGSCLNKKTRARRFIIAPGWNDRELTSMNIVQPTTTPPALSPDLIAKFRAIVGDKYAVTDQADIAPYTTEERDLFRGRSPLVLRPGSTAEGSAVW